MASPNQDGEGVKVESSTTDGGNIDNQHGGHHNKFGNPRRGAGKFGGGNRRFGQNQQQRGKNENFQNQKREGGGTQRGFHNQGDHMMSRNPIDQINMKLAQISGPTLDLQPLDMVEKKFSCRNRLYVGNIGNEVTDADLTEFFKNYGEISEVFVNKEKNFGFIKFDYHSNAEKAKRELDGTPLKGRNLKLRFAPGGTTIKVKNLTPYVSNELLYTAFQVFGEIERALVVVDERGKPTGEGIIDFQRKPSALAAVRHCSEGCFFLTSSLRPCIVESFDVIEDSDGFPDKNIMRRNPEFQKAREVGPRFANSSSFEHEYGMRWKQLNELYAQKEQALKKELEMEKEKLEAQMEYAKYEHETEMLREQLRSREMDRDRQKREWEMKERQAEEQRQRTEEQMRRQEEEMQARMLHQEEELRRRQQENTLFMQAHQLDNMLDQQEQAYDRPNLFQGNADTSGLDAKNLMGNFDRENRFDNRNAGKMGGNRGHWNNDNRREDYPMKRRRF